MSNVAKAVGGQSQSAQIAASIQQQNQVQKDIENANRIQKTNEKGQNRRINPDEKNGGGAPNKNPNQNAKENPAEPDNDEKILNNFNAGTKESLYLGTIIDITR